MTVKKERLTVTVDHSLVRAANLAVREGRADSVSAWVSSALMDQVERERGRKALADAIAHYEAEFGVITEAEMEAQELADKRTAIVFPRKRPGKRRGTSR
jgi:hypothetical protein